MDIYTNGAIDSIKERINKLTPESQRQWGTMNVAQMLAHCNAALNSVTSGGQDKQSFIGKIFGKWAKKSFTEGKPFKQNLPTAKGFIVTDQRDFNREKQELLEQLSKVEKNGKAMVDGRVHAFFGKMSVNEWALLMHNHLDHHLRQFGV